MTFQDCVFGGVSVPGTVSVEIFPPEKAVSNANNGPSTGTVVIQVQRSKEQKENDGTPPPLKTIVQPSNRQAR